MRDIGPSVRWRGTVLAGTGGAPAILHDDWSLASEDGEVYARVFRSRTGSERYFGAVCIGRPSVAGDIHLNALPSRKMAMLACEKRLEIIARVLTQ